MNSVLQAITGRKYHQRSLSVQVTTIADAAQKQTPAVVGHCREELQWRRMAGENEARRCEALGPDTSWEGGSRGRLDPHAFCWFQGRSGTRRGGIDLRGGGRGYLVTGLKKSVKNNYMPCTFEQKQAYYIALYL